MICSYGCGQEAKYPFKNGKWCCSESWNSCPEIKTKNSMNNLGHKDYNPQHKENKKTVYCKYCNNIYAKTGIKTHELSCYLNPKNKKDCPICGNPIKNFRDNKTCSRKCGAIIGRLTKSTGNTKVNYRTICFYHHGHKCIICNEDLFLAAHHVNGDRTNNEPENLIPLCHTHHLYMHHCDHYYILKECVDEYLENFKRKNHEMPM